MRRQHGILFWLPLIAFAHLEPPRECAVRVGFNPLSRLRLATSIRSRPCFLQAAVDYYGIVLPQFAKRREWKSLGRMLVI
jgi:hypothetical protein